MRLVFKINLYDKKFFLTNINIFSPSLLCSFLYYFKIISKFFPKYLSFTATLRNNNVTAMLDIMMLDDQRSHLNKWTDVILQDKKASSFIQGIGVHWYASVEDAFPHFDQMDDVNQKYPDKYILATEGKYY